MEIKKIEILNEQDFDRVIDKNDFEKFICTGEKFKESECKFRIAFYSNNRDLFDEITESMIACGADFIAFGGNIGNEKYLLLEVYC